MDSAGRGRQKEQMGRECRISFGESCAPPDTIGPFSGARRVMKYFETSPTWRRRVFTGHRRDGCGERALNRCCSSCGLSSDKACTTQSMSYSDNNISVNLPGKRPSPEATNITHGSDSPVPAPPPPLKLPSAPFGGVHAFGPLATTNAPGFAGMSTGVNAFWSKTGFCGFNGFAFLVNDFLAGGDAVEGDGGRTSSSSSSCSESASPPGDDGWDNSHSTAWVASPPERSSAARAFLSEKPMSMIFTASGGRLPLLFLVTPFLSWDELRGSRSCRPFLPISVAPPRSPRDTGGGDILFDRDGTSDPNGPPTLTDDGLDPPGADPGAAGGPEGGGGRPGTDFLPPPSGGERTVPGGGGAPAGGLATAAGRDMVAGLVVGAPPDRGGVTAEVGLNIPAPAKRSLEMGAGRLGAGAASSSPPLMKAPRAYVKVLSFFLRSSSSARSASDGWGWGGGTAEANEENSGPHGKRGWVMRELDKAQQCGCFYRRTRPA